MQKITVDLSGTKVTITDNDDKKLGAGDKIQVGDGAVRNINDPLLAKELQDAGIELSKLIGTDMSRLQARMIDNYKSNLILVPEEMIVAGPVNNVGNVIPLENNSIELGACASSSCNHWQILWRSIPVGAFYSYGNDTIQSNDQFRMRFVMMLKDKNLF